MQYEAAVLSIFIMKVKLIFLQLVPNFMCLSSDSLLKNTMSQNFSYSSHPSLLLSFNNSCHLFFTMQALPSFHVKFWLHQNSMWWITKGCLNPFLLLVPVNKLEEWGGCLCTCGVTVKLVEKPRCAESWAVCNSDLSVISVLVKQQWQFLGRLLLSTDRFWFLESFYSLNTILLDGGIRNLKCCFSVTRYQCLCWVHRRFWKGG